MLNDRSKSSYPRLFMLMLIIAAAAFAFEIKTSAADSAYTKVFGEQDYFICVHKLSYTLELFKRGEANPIRTYKCAVGKNTGDKQRAGDNTTPTSWGGVLPSIPGAAPKTESSKIPFVVEEIDNARNWTHDFGDGKSEIKGAYGPWFISLNTGWDGIGIHGTHDPGSIGTNASEGCIRLHNKDVAELKKLIASKNKGIGVRVIILED
ncbi:MAG: L,D-transpeptidase [Selenomonadaceae bacterium]|nr:L,D-transpeptidase [Selenomonadaceae bacterium]